MAMVVFSAQAQDKNPDLQRELTLEKEYNPNLRDANKINQLPEIKAPQAPQTRVEFSNYTLDCTIPPSIQPLGVVNYFPDFATSNKRGYFNLGVSSLLDVDGDAGYQILNSAEDRLNIFGSHRSSNSNVRYLQEEWKDSKQKMKINDNLLGTDYTHAFAKARLNADAQYTYSGFNYYGHWERTPEIEYKDQVNNLFRSHAGITSVDNEEIAYQINLAYTLFKQQRGDFETFKGRTENRIMADVDLHAPFNATSGIGFGGYIKNYSYNLSSDYTTLSANPYLTFEGDTWDARLGATANAQVGGIKKFIVAPDIRLNWRPVESFLVYLSAEGGIKDNSNYDLYYENRYVNPAYRVYDSKSPLDGTLGINFTPVTNLNIGIFTGYKFVKDEHFYLNPGTLLTPLYLNAEIFKLGGSLRYAYRDMFDLSLQGTYYGWNITKPSNLQGNDLSNVVLEAWNKPVFAGDVRMGFKIPEIPFRIDVAYHIETGRKALTGFWGSREKMKDIHDVNCKGTYTLNETVSVFVKANNLLFQKYDLWYGYPAQNFSIMLGINVKF
jgi:hypothetical protein